MRRLRGIPVQAGLQILAAILLGCGEDLAAPEGSVVIVTAATSGSDPDPDGFVLSVDTDAGRALETHGTIALSGLAPGEHRLTLGGAAPNCIVAGDNPR